MMTADTALNKVIDFIRLHEYDGEIALLDIEKRGRYMDVFLLKPYGLFIVSPDGSVKDNYNVFT